MVNVVHWWLKTVAIREYKDFSTIASAVLVKLSCAQDIHRDADFNSGNIKLLHP